MFQSGVFTTVENHELGYPQQTQEHSKICTYGPGDMPGELL